MAAAVLCDPRAGGGLWPPMTSCGSCAVHFSTPLLAYKLPATGAGKSTPAAIKLQIVLIVGHKHDCSAEACIDTTLSQRCRAFRCLPAGAGAVSWRSKHTQQRDPTQLGPSLQSNNQRFWHTAACSSYSYAGCHFEALRDSDAPRPPHVPRKRPARCLLTGKRM